MNVLIVGGTGALGSALVRFYREAGHQVFATWHHSNEDLDEGVQWHPVDVRSADSVAELCERLPAKLHIVVNCVGVLHGNGFQPEKTIRGIDADQVVETFKINTLGTMLLAQSLAKRLKHEEQAKFVAISARVGSIEDNRAGGWYSYRCTKAALNMVVKSLSIEWRLSNPRCSVAVLHPGTVQSKLSEPFTSRSKNIFTPEESATSLARIIESLNPGDTGKFWAWDGSEIPW